MELDVFAEAGLSYTVHVEDAFDDAEGRTKIECLLNWLAIANSLRGD